MFSRLSEDLLPVRGQKYRKFEELFMSVQQHDTLQGNGFQKEVDETINDIECSLKAKKSADEDAGRSYDLDTDDLEEYCILLEDLEEKAKELESQRGDGNLSIKSGTTKYIICVSILFKYLTK